MGFLKFLIDFEDHSNIATPSPLLVDIVYEQPLSLQMTFDQEGDTEQTKLLVLHKITLKETFQKKSYKWKTSVF